MIKNNFLLFFIVAFISACSLYNVNYEETATSFYPAKKSSQEVKYLEEITKPHEVIGFITVNTERRQKMDEVMEKMKREAAALGGDAITDITMSNGKDQKKLTGSKLFANANIRTTFTATVVAFKQSPQEFDQSFTDY